MTCSGLCKPTCDGEHCPSCQSSPTKPRATHRATSQQLRTSAPKLYCTCCTLPFVESARSAKKRRCTEERRRQCHAPSNILHMERDPTWRRHEDKMPVLLTILRHARGDREQHGHTQRDTVSQAGCPVLARQLQPPSCPAAR